MIESALFNVREGEQDHIDEIHDYGDENQQQQTQDSDVWVEQSSNRKLRLIF